MQAETETLIFNLFGLLATPLVNTNTRIGEREADRYSLETAKLPDALPACPVRMAEYRYPRLRPMQGTLFYTPPSLEKRVLSVMEWKAAHPAG